MRKFLFTFGALFLFSLALPALADAPDANTKYTSGYVRANLTKGKTTLNEVNQRFGKPADVSRRADDSGDTEYWIYDKSKEGAKGFFSRIGSRASGALSAIGGTSAGSAAISPVRDVQSKGYQAEYAAGNVNQAVGTQSNGDDRPFSTIRIEFHDGVVSGYTLQ